ncbi:MAG: rhomboid family intramembrane serine protease [Halapricum sp.]
MRRSSPTLTLVLAICTVAIVQALLWLFFHVSPWAFALTWPLDNRPLTLLTSVFAHAGPIHLLSNLLGLTLLGLLVERRTSRFRFYAFFLLTGILAGVMQVTVATIVFDQRAAVLGASGAVFGLFGYFLAGNRLTGVAAAGVSIQPRVQLLVLLVVATVLTLVTAGPKVALIAHFTGLVIGLLAGREHLLRSSPS